MYGADAYGSIPYGAASFTAEDIFDVDAMLAAPRTELVVTVELTVWEIGGSAETKLYLGSAEWASAPTDIPSSTPFSGRLESYTFRRSINNGDRFGGMATGEGTIVFANADGAYDDYIDGYAINGREVVVRIGRKSDAFADHFILFRGVAVDWSADADAVTLTIRDKSDLLNVPAQPNLYAGTGGAEGGANLAGKRKPLLLGLMEVVPAVLVNEAALIYQVHDGTFEDYSLNSVWDRGLNLSTDIAGTDYGNYSALAAASLPGDYNTCSAEGLFRLSADPAGWVAISARSTDTQDNTSAGLIRGIVDRATDLSDSDLDEGSFDEVLIAQPAIVGFFIAPEDSKTAADVIQTILAGIGGWGGFTRDGKLAIGIFTAPAGSPIAYFDRDSVIDLNRETMPSGIWPPPWRWRVAFRPLGLVTSDLAGAAVSSGALEYFAKPYRTITDEDETIVDDYARAQDPPPIEAGFSVDTVGAAEAEAARLLTLYSSGYRLLRFSAPRTALTLKIGDEVRVVWPRFGLDAGRNLRIVSIEDKIELGEGGAGISVEITAFG